STSTFPTTAFPSYSLLNSSMIGPTILQGPHQAAQKSTITGLSLFKTVSSKFASVISNAIIFNLFYYTILVFYFMIPYKLIITNIYFPISLIYNSLLSSYEVNYFYS